MGAMESPKLSTVSGQANLAHTPPITVSPSVFDHFNNINNVHLINAEFLVFIISTYLVLRKRSL